MRIGPNNRLKSVLLFLLLGSYTNLQAQEYMAHVTKIGMGQGLSSYNVNGVFQDSEGYIWIATDYGLNRYDGAVIKSYTKEESGLCHNYVSNIMEDRNGMLWIAAGDRGGDWHYCIFDKKKGGFYSPESYLGKPLPFLPQKTIVYDHRGVIIFCEHKNGTSNNFNVYEYDGKEIQSVFSIAENSADISGKTLEGVFKDSENRYISFWRDRDKEKSIIVLFDNKGRAISTYQCDNEHPKMLGIRSIGGNHCILCADEKSGYWQLELQYNFKKHQKQGIVVKADWGERIGISNDKTYVLNADSLKIYSKEGFLEARLYLGLSLKTTFFGLPFVDRDGNIWVNDQEYLYCISPEKKRFIVELQHPDNPIRLRGIAHNAEGNLLAGGISFLHEQQGGDNWQTVPIPGNNFLGILQKDSILWLGTEAYQLIRLNSKTKKLEAFLIRMGEKNLSPLIWMPFVSAGRQVWAGGNKGLYRLDEAKKCLVSFRDTTLNGSAVYAFHENKAGTWLCTSSGLFLVDLQQEKVLKHYSKYKQGKSYIPAENIAHLHEDKKGIFWLATKGEGLIRWNPETGGSRQYTQKKDGLSHNVLYSVYGDDYGNLWISSKRGLMRFQKETASINIYLKEDGLPHNEFNTISHYQAPDGHLYFGGQNGLVHFHPSNFEEINKKHPFLITEYSKQESGSDSLLYLTAALRENSIITIYPGDKSVIVKFALLDYRNSQNHLYSYRIEGYDKDWIYQTDNQIRLNGLPYGTYTLKIRAKNANANTWTDYPKNITIKVLRPFYLQIWFILLMLALVAVAVYAAVRYRIRSLQAGKAQLEKIVKERTEKIENDKLLIEQQAAELRTLDELKTKFFSNISHELRTPLTLILGPLSYILDNPDAWEQASVKEQLLVMQRNGKSLMALIEEILDLSKLEANKLDLQEEPTPVRQFLEYILAVFEPQLQAQKLGYELRCNFKNEQLTVLMDRKKIEKVINNYLSNAIKFTPKNGRITLGASEEDDMLKICVSDTGKGVHPNDLPYIFERFYQSKQADQNLYGGTGIGLALVSDFARLMDGKAYAESTPGEGSRFYFEIPAKVAAIESVNEIARTEEKLEEELIDQVGYDFTILVVEDNSDMRDFVCRLLQKQYKTVLTAHNGAEGLQMLKTQGNDIDLIVSDVMMPEVDGLTMLKEIKSNPGWMGIPVIMLTALAAERDKLNALTIGVDDYLTKPFSVSELLIRVQNLLYNHHQRRQFKAKPLDAPELVEAEGIAAEIIVTPDTDNAWIKEVEKKVLESLNNQIIDVDGLALALFISSRQLSRKINAITGLSTSRFIREVQLRAALKDLEDGTVISVTEVCFNNGFEQVSTFSKLFKKRFGKNPSEYLKGDL